MEKIFVAKSMCSLGKIEESFSHKLMDFFIQGVKKVSLKLYFVFDKPCDKKSKYCFRVLSKAGFSLNFR